MTTDDERREVARRLRCAAEQGQPYTQPTLACFVDADCMDIWTRLADLIEPGEPKVKCVADVKVDGERLEQLVHDAAVELTGIDRDALLELADEMQRELDECASDHEIAGNLQSQIDRIREALGVCDG